MRLMLDHTMYCRGCEKYKSKDEFYPSARKHARGRCKVCSKEPARQAQARYRNTAHGHAALKEAHARWVANNSDYLREREALRAASTEGYLQSITKKHGARNSMMLAAGERTGTGIDYDHTYLVAVYSNQPYCVVTGAEISIGSSRQGCGYSNPWVASVDRIDQAQPYSKENIRLVANIYNLTRGRWADNLVSHAAQHVLGIREYRLRPGETWVSRESAAPKRAKGRLASYLAGQWAARDRSNRFATTTVERPLNADWVAPRLDRDQVFGVRMVWSENGTHPLQPSVDRLQNDFPHEQSNCRIVPYFANLGMHDFPNRELEFRRLLELIFHPVARSIPRC